MRSLITGVPWVPKAKITFICTMQFAERLCRSSSSVVRKRGISCPELRYKIYHGVCRCCCPYRCNRFTEIFSVYNTKFLLNICGQRSNHYGFGGNYSGLLFSV